MSSRKQRARASSSDSSAAGSSTDDDIRLSTVARLANNKPVELSLKDDEDTITYQAPLPDDEG